MGAMSIDLFVPGIPVPQGSMKGYVRRGKGGGAGTVALTNNNPKLIEWRMKVTGHAIAKQPEWAEVSKAVFPMEGPIGIRLDFILPRPQSHYGTGRNAKVLKPSAPKYPTGTPDLDKLVRAILDALTDARVWDDDSQVVLVKAVKEYEGPSWPQGTGVRIHMGAMP
jgi:Holliday junction resolvase RusA-like endonuclease